MGWRGGIVGASQLDRSILRSPWRWDKRGGFIALWNRYVMCLTRRHDFRIPFCYLLPFVARDRNTWEGYKFNFIPRLNIISADIYGKYHAIVCCVTIKHRFIILSYSILDICCSNNIAGRYFFQTVLSTEISPTVNNYRYRKLKKEWKRKNKCILDIHAYTYITRRRRQRRWLKEEALSFRIHLPKWILVRYSFTFTCREFSLFLSKSVALFIARIDL